MKIISIRNIITHGGDIVTEKLGELCRQGKNVMFPYKTGEKISVNLLTLASVECFFNRVLIDINNELMVNCVHNYTTKTDEI